MTKRCSGKKTIVEIGARKGSYDGAPSTRAISIVMEGVSGATASLNGAALPASAICTGGGRTVISLGEHPVGEPLRVEIVK